LFLALLVAGCGISAAGNRIDKPKPPIRSIPAGLLVPSIQTIDIGTVPQAGKREIRITLTNPTSTTIHVVAIETSCPCLRFKLERAEIEPGEVIAGEISLDFKDEPEFTGSLQIDVRGQSSDVKLAVSIEVKVVVRPLSEANP
jgi:hypothetical protein